MSNIITSPTDKSERRAKILVALIAAFATILAACFQFAPKPPGEKKFTGRVSNARTEKPIRSAKVTLEAQGVPPLLYTDAEGVFSFPLKDELNELRVRVEAAGYKNYDRRINPAAKAPGEIEEIRLDPTRPEVSATIIFHNPQGKRDEKKEGSNR